MRALPIVIRVVGLIAVVGLVVLAAFTWIVRPLRSPPASVGTPVYWPTESWRTSTPEEQGFDSVKLAEGLQSLRDKGVGIDSLLIIRNGYVLLDAYFYPYDGSWVHDLSSVTKSFTTTLIGIAAGQGKLQLDQTMVSFFPDWTIANLDARKQQITVGQLTGMVNGLDSGCLSGDEPTLNAMRAQPDWILAALDRKVVRQPGSSFCYDSPGMHLLSAILQKVTGMTELDFGRKYLFEPLGIKDVVWESDPQGYTHGWGDLHLKPRDAAKLGYLWLSNGVWDGRQIVPANWVKAAVSAHVHAGQDDYGYGWWVSKDAYWALGRGGRYVKVFPAYNTIVVTTASQLNFDQIDPLLHSAFKDPARPLPANPEGVAKLQATLATLLQASKPFPVAPLPATATEISGKTYVFGKDAADAISLETLRFEFKDGLEGALYLNLQSGEQRWLIGLDGKFRMNADAQAVRGYWPDPQTFVMEVFGERIYQFRFRDERLVLSSPNVPQQFEARQLTP
jgi:CubicO group peptidase (beta-lactamase class C family)